MGGPEQRGGGSLVFKSLVRGGSFNFQQPLGVCHGPNPQQRKLLPVPKDISSVCAIVNLIKELYP